MFKAVNVKDYRFGKNGCIIFEGFAILDTESNEILSMDGRLPYVLNRKKVIQSCIDGGWVDTMKRVTFTTRRV